MILELTDEEAELTNAAINEHLGTISTLRRLTQCYATNPDVYHDLKEVEKMCLGLSNRIYVLRNANPQQPPSGEVQGETPV